MSHLNTAKNTFMERCMDNRFTMSQEKIMVTCFSRHNIPNTANLTINDILLTSRSEIQYLGVVLDRNHHGNFKLILVAKCNTALKFLQAITRASWSLVTEIAITFYRAYIRSIIDYGTILYSNACQTRFGKIKLIQKKALRICIGAMNSTPVETIRVESN